MNKASGGDGIPAELFQILRDDVVKALNSIHQQIGKTALATELEKVSFHCNAKECSNYCTTALCSHASKVMLKDSSSWASTVHNRELLGVQVSLKNAEETEIKLEKTLESPLNKLKPVNPKEKQCQRMLKLPHNCTHLPHY